MDPHAASAAADGRLTSAAAPPRARVSVIIPARGITPELRESLGAFRALELPVEIVVLPDGALSADLPDVRVLATGPVGPGTKRDVGARAARGDVLAFLDDDAYPAADWLHAALRHFDDPTVGAVGGPAVTPPDDGFWAHASGAVFTSWLGSGPLRMRFHPVGSVRDVDDWPSVNLLVRRDAFHAVGGFSTPYWPGEDTKLCRALVHRGFRIRYDPAALVFHHRATTPLRHLRQVGRYGLHRGHFARVYPETSRRITYALPLFGLVSLLVLGMGAAVAPPVRAVVGILAGAGAVLLGISGLQEAVRARKPLLLGAFPPLLVATHATYALAFLCGLVVRRIGRYGRGDR